LQERVKIHSQVLMSHLKWCKISWSNLHSVEWHTKFGTRQLLPSFFFSRPY